MNKKVLIIAGLIFITITALMYIFFKTFFVKYEHRIISRPSIKAMKNPFLAAERFLTQIGRNAQSLSDRSLLITLPSENDLIIINKFGANLPADEEEILVNWIKKGGYLVITADRIWDKDLLKTGNNLLDRFKIRLEIDAEEEKGKKFVHQIWLGKDNFAAKVAFFSNRSLAGGNGMVEKKYGDFNGIHFIQLGIGEGKLIVLSDNEFMLNRNIKNNEHAFFLSNLTQNRSKTWLVYSNNMPSLLSLIWKNASMFVICMAVLLLLCMLRLNLKSGPMLPETNNSRRNLMEHLEASGNYLFKLNRGKGMLEKNQKAAERFLTEKLLFAPSATNFEKSSTMEKKVNLPAQIIQYALFEKDIEDEQAFINKSAVLQYLTGDYTDNFDYKGIILKGKL